MSLIKYRRKRDFQKTPEPAGEMKRSEPGFQFVIQKHAARRLHYDFRLELDGSLKMTRGRHSFGIGALTCEEVL